MIKIDSLKIHTESAIKKLKKNQSIHQTPGFEVTHDDLDISQSIHSHCVSTPRSIANLQNLMHMQEILPDHHHRKQAIQHGHDVLNLLDHIRLGLFEGHLATHYIKQIDSILHTQLPKFEDSNLNEVINMVRQRAAIELAKINRIGKLSN